MPVQTRTSAALLAAAIAAAASAQQTITIQPPTLNRWMYPFDANPGNRAEASTFGSILISGFDDRDAEFLLGFDTSSLITPGLGPANYNVQSLRISLWISSGGRFEYDPTLDPIASWYPTTDPAYVADADTGRPIEIFGAGYRNGWTASTFLQTSPFASSPPLVPPAEGNRNVFAADYDASGVAIDVSRQVRQRLSNTSWGIGLTAGIFPPGSLVPTDTRFNITVDVARPGVREYVQRALDAGRLNLIVTSLHPASGGPGQPPSTNYPVFYTKENPLGVALGFTPRLEMTVTVGNACYANCDGSTAAPVLNALDFNCFLTRYRAGEEYANCDGSTTAPTLNALDFTCFLDRYRAGCQ